MKSVNMISASVIFVIFLVKLQVAFCERDLLTSDKHKYINISFAPPKLPELIWKTSDVVVMNISCGVPLFDDLNALKIIRFYTSDAYVANVKVDKPYVINCSEDQSVEFKVYGYHLGYANLTIHINEYVENNETKSASSGILETYEVVVHHNRTLISDVFIITVAIMMIVLSFGFGCRIHVGDVKKIFQKPVAPALGLGCQFIFMPLIGIALTQILRMDHLLGFGLFVVACSPGGGGSNVWTVLLDGDLDLSMTMTLFSKTFALATMPAWLFAAGGLYGDIAVTIPYRNIIVGLISIAVPCLFGVLLRWKKKNVAVTLGRAVKCVSGIFIVWLLIVGSLSNYYVFSVMIQKWYILPASILLPYLGVLVGGIIATIFHQPKPRIITIGIETGVQDTGIAILLLLSSFGRPSGSIAAAVPIATACMTPIPFLIYTIYLIIRNRCWRRGKCQSCGGPEEVIDESKDEAAEQERLRSQEDSNDEPTFSDIAKNGSHSCKYDVAMDKFGGFIDNESALKNGSATKNNYTTTNERF